MRTTWVIAFSIVVGIVLGAGLVEALHAQGKPQAYVVGEINVTDPEGFAKEFSPLARKALAEAPSYRALALGGKTIAIEGRPPKRASSSMYSTISMRQCRPIIHLTSKPRRKSEIKYATFRTYAVEGR